jgi:preprotein translocase subunit SecY
MGVLSKVLRLDIKRKIKFIILLFLLYCIATVVYFYPVNNSQINTFSSLHPKDVYANFSIFTNSN